MTTVGHDVTCHVKVNQKCSQVVWGVDGIWSCVWVGGEQYVTWGLYISGSILFTVWGQNTCQAVINSEVIPARVCVFSHVIRRTRVGNITLFWGLWYRQPVSNTPSTSAVLWCMISAVMLYLIPSAAYPGYGKWGLTAVMWGSAVRFSHLALLCIYCQSLNCTIKECVLSETYRHTRTNGSTRKSTRDNIIPR